MIEEGEIGRRARNMGTSELVEKIQNFLNDERRVSIKTRSIQFGNGVATVYTRLFMKI